MTQAADAGLDQVFHIGHWRDVPKGVAVRVNASHEDATVVEAFATRQPLQRRHAARCTRESDGEQSEQHHDAHVSGVMLLVMLLVESCSSMSEAAPAAPIQIPAKSTHVQLEKSVGS